LGIVYLVVIFIVQLFISSAPAKDSGGIKASPLDKDYRHMLKVLRFWLLVMILALGVFSGMVISSSSAQIGMTQYGLLSGALVVSLFSIFNSIGRLFFGGLTDTFGRYNSLLIVYLFTSVCLLACFFFNVISYVFLFT
ncbi:MFS transporter, partial [Salmonella enterica]|uniref:MFS transporter n=1 Tax=Salmonella enterica TaxID=28901 RepID=UPI00398C27C4